MTLKWQEKFSIRFDEHFEIYKSSQFLNFIDEFENYNGSKDFQKKVIISYHTLRDERVMAKLADSFFEVDSLIMDEAHTMRNYDTSTFKSGQIVTANYPHVPQGFITIMPQRMVSSFTLF